MTQKDPSPLPMEENFKSKFRHSYAPAKSTVHAQQNKAFGCNS